MHGPACICWANLTPFSLEGELAHGPRGAGRGGLWPAAPGGPARARSHCRSALLLIHFTPDSRTHSVPLYLKRQCNRTLGSAQVDLQRRHGRRGRRERRGGRPRRQTQQALRAAALTAAARSVVFGQVFTYRGLPKTLERLPPNADPVTALACGTATRWQACERPANATAPPPRLLGTPAAAAASRELHHPSHHSRPVVTGLEYQLHCPTPMPFRPRTRTTYLRPRAPAQPKGAGRPRGATPGHSLTEARAVSE